MGIVQAPDTEEEISEETFRKRMAHFLKSHSGALGEDLKLLDQPDGLDALFKKYCPGQREDPAQR